MMRASGKIIGAITRTRIVSLMFLVAFSAVAILSTKKVAEYYRFKPIREQRLQLADTHKTLLQIEAKFLSRPSPDPWINEFHADMIRHRTYLEQKYRKGAQEPWADLPPDPSEPPSILDRLESNLTDTNTQMHRLAEDVQELLSENVQSEKTPELKPPPEPDTRRMSPFAVRMLLERKRRQLMEMRATINSRPTSTAELPEFF